MKGLTKILLPLTFITMLSASPKNSKAQGYLNSGIKIPTNSMVKEYFGPLFNLNIGVKKDLFEGFHLGTEVEMNVMDKKPYFNIKTSMKEFVFSGYTGYNSGGLSLSGGIEVSILNWDFTEEKYQTIQGPDGQTYYKNSLPQIIHDESSQTSFGEFVKVQYEFPIDQKIGLNISGKLSVINNTDGYIDNGAITLSVGLTF